MQSLSKVSAVQTRGSSYGRFNKRWLHGSLARQASIRMPAMSPVMTEGTITRWRKKEGDAFAAGEVLLQIESDFYAVDVEAERSGILGKILLPDGSANVPVEQIIALVAQDPSELAELQSLHSSPLTSVSAPPPLVNLDDLPSPRRPTQLTFLSPCTTPTMSTRTPSLFEKHSMGYGQRSINTPSVRASRPKMLALEVHSGAQFSPCPSPRYPRSATIPSPFRMQLREDVGTTPLPSTPLTARWPAQLSASISQEKQIGTQVDGCAIRRMIVSSLASRRSDTPGIEITEFL